MRDIQRISQTIAFLSRTGIIRECPAIVVGGIIDSDKGSVVAAAVIGGAVLAELRAVDPEPQPAQFVYGPVQACVDIVAQRSADEIRNINRLPAGRGLQERTGRSAAKFRQRAPCQYMMSWRYDMETLGLRRVILRQNREVISSFRTILYIRIITVSQIW